MASIFAAPAGAAHNAHGAHGPFDARLIAFAIAGGPLDAVVRGFVLATGVSVSYEPGTVKGRSSAGVHGRFSASEALARLLAGTGVTAIAQDNGDLEVARYRPGYLICDPAVAGLRISGAFPAHFIAATPTASLPRCRTRCR